MFELLVCMLHTYTLKKITFKAQFQKNKNKKNLNNFMTTLESRF